MQPIASSIAPSLRQNGADTPEPSPESTDGFGALLAGFAALPASATQSSSGSQLTFASNKAADASELADGAAAPTEDGSVTPGSMAPPAAAPSAAAGAATPKTDAATPGVPGGAAGGTPNLSSLTDPGVEPGELAETHPGAGQAPNADPADQAARATAIAKATATHDTTDAAGTLAPAAGRADGRSTNPHSKAGRGASSDAVARLEQLATGRHAQMTPTLAQAEHAAGSPASVAARPILPVFAMVATQGDLGRSDVSSGELADGSLLRGLAMPASGGSEPSVANLTGTPTGGAVQPTRQLAIAIDRAVAGEVRQLTIQLSPQELGAIDIALSFDEERRLSISILAERPETLELLKGETRQLERLLGRQGIDLANAGLELGLMSQERHGDGNTHKSAGEHTLQALGEHQGEGEPFSNDTLPDGAAMAIGADRRLNLSI